MAVYFAFIFNFGIYLHVKKLYAHVHNLYTFLLYHLHSLHVYLNFFSPDDDMCPVKSFMKYKRHLNTKCIHLFQRPSTKPNSITWYDNIPLGENTIGNVMTQISEKAGLSRRYTNHSPLYMYWMPLENMQINIL